MRPSFWHLPKRCRCGELLCRRSRVRPARSFRIRCLRCRKARRKQRVCLLCKSTSRFQPQNQPGHRSALQRSEVRLPPERFCCVPFLLLHASFRLRRGRFRLSFVRFRLQCDCSPPRCVSLRLLRDWSQPRLFFFLLLFPRRAVGRRVQHHSAEAAITAGAASKSRLKLQTAHIHG